MKDIDSINRRKFLGYIGCCSCGLLISSCSTVPITERKQLTLLPESTLNRQAAQIYENVKKKTKLSDDKKQIVLTHAKKAYESLYQNKELDIEFLNLILHHHGKEDGIGFSDTISSDFPDLLMIYRVCEDFAIELIEESLQGNFNVIKIYEKINLIINEIE